MKKLQLSALLLLVSFSIYGQKVQLETVYRRSSLYTMMINDTSRLYAKEIKKAFTSSPIPDKFNDHLLDSRSIENGVNEFVKKREEKIKIQQENISNYTNNSDLAKSIVSKWFNRTEKGTFDMDLISERGSYNASEIDVAIAKGSKRGMALLSDAGEELIRNTFVVVNDFHYISKEEVANKTRNVLSMIADVAEIVDEENTDLTSTIETADVSLEMFGKGYVIRTTSYLYQLEWNDSVAAIFYNDYWNDENSFEPSRKEAFDNSDIFKLKLIGYEVAWADLQATVFTQKTEEELIAVATVRATDAVIAKLQKKYEVFRTKTPLFSVDPLAAKIGLKEGVEKGDKFEVLEQIMDKNGRTSYKRRGIVRVDKNQIWDNRYMAGKDPKKTDALIEKPAYTVFKGGKKLYPGMLIRQTN